MILSCKIALLADAYLYRHTPYHPHQEVMSLQMEPFELSCRAVRGEPWCIPERGNTLSSLVLEGGQKTWPACAHVHFTTYSLGA